MSTTEERIAAALSAYSGGITMDSSTIEKRLAAVREQSVRSRGRRRPIAVGAAVLAAAAAVLAAFALAGGLPGGEDRALPDVADRPPAAQAPQALVGDGFPTEGTTYSVESLAVPFTFAVPAKGDVPGTWHYGSGETFGVNLDQSVATGHASVNVAVPEQVYDPTLPQPFVGVAPLVAAPVDAAGWQQWLVQTGVAEVTATEELDLNGVAATRLSVDVADGLPAQTFPCVPRESCLALAPNGPSLIGAASSTPFTVELTVVELEERTVLVTTMGAEPTKDQWLPVMRSLVDSLRFS